MSLALLGATAAVGLAIVALALNQGWPLVPGSGIPSLPPRHQDVGAAAVAARPHPARSSRTHASGPQGRAASSAPRNPAAAGDSGQAATPASPAELVVTPATPAPSHGSGGKSKDTPSPQSPAPAQAQTTTQEPPAQATPPPAPPPVQPSPAAETPPQAEPPATVSSAPPEESNVPAWSNGNGHAYGRSSSGDDHDGGHGEGRHW